MEQIDQVERDEEQAVARGAEQPAASSVRQRVDPRTGKLLTLHDASFWREHDAERRRCGQSVVEYCAAQGLALSTFRRWASRFNQESGTPDASSPPFLALPIRSNERACNAASVIAVEVVLGEGVSVKLGGEAGARVIECVLARLGAGR